ncbi:MAG: cytochrome C [Meiothermus sp.]
MKTIFWAICTALIAVWAWAAPAANQAGAKLYAANCQGCHGVGAGGVNGVGPVLKGEVAGWKFELFKRAVLTGVNDAGETMNPAMPHFAKKGFAGKTPTDAQLREIQAYLKSLK